jgi:hypothetical protein
MVDIPIMVALLDGDRVVIAAIAVAHNIAVAHHVDVAVAVPLAYRYADRADADADFFRTGWQGGSDHRGGRYGS